MMKSDRLRKMARSLIGEEKDTFWKLAEVLTLVWEGAYYHAWGFDSFASYVDTDLHIKVRRAQYMVGMWRWKESLSLEAQEWAMGQSWSIMRLVYRFIDSSNWKMWKRQLDGMTFRSVENLVRGVAEMEDERARALVLENARRQACQRRATRAQNMAVMRSAGVRASEAATEFDVREEDVRGQLRLVQAFVPMAVWQWMSMDAREGNMDVSVWLSRFLEREARAMRRSKVRVA